VTIHARAHVATARAPRARVNGGAVAAALLTVGSIAETATRAAGSSIVFAA